MRTMHVVWLKATKRAKDRKRMLSLNEAIGQLAIANSVSQYWHVSWRGSNALGIAIEIEVHCNKRRMWKTGEKESDKAGLSKEDVPC